MNEEENIFSDPRKLRKKAEERLEEKRKKNGTALPPLDTQRLIHELQVHQIELELQNEEMHQAWERAEAALKKYTVFFDFAPVAYFMLDRAAAIRELNFAAATLLGGRRLNLLDSNFKLFISEDSRPAFNDFFQEVYSSFSRETCEITLLNRNDAVVYAYLEGVVIGDDDQCFLAVLDMASLRG